MSLTQPPPAWCKPCSTFKQLEYDAHGEPFVCKVGCRDWKEAEVLQHIHGELVSAREDGHELPVCIDGPPDRPLLAALNECGYCGTGVDLFDVLRWVKRTHPEWIEQA